MSTINNYIIFLKEDTKYDFSEAQGSLYEIRQWNQTCPSMASILNSGESCDAASTVPPSVQTSTVDLPETTAKKLVKFTLHDVRRGFST